MSGNTYGQQAAADYRASREIPRDGLDSWRRAVAEEAALKPGATLIDVGAGTGAFAAAFHDWFGVRVLAVEPAEAMRALIPVAPGIEVLDGTGEALPVADGAADAAWLGSVLHHLSDLGATARELRRALKPGAPVLIRNAFPGRCDRDLRVRFFPETARQIADYASVEQVTAAFAAEGFRQVALRSLPQQNAPTLAAFAAGLRRASDSKLRALSDEEYERGLAALHAAAAADPAEPAVSWMDLLVLA
ncbi:class I SAM-dependent methyltransferase [Streptacidiphilus sp. N1-12]|uniref:Class I SAM-dependent methyltransferase n=2 Tax=Streptacidiphilus alkalitolerans TaxID=3342712 RepID=A0ABV6XCZ8_9ACTN